MNNQTYQFTVPVGWPVCLKLGSPNGFAYLKLTGGRWLQWNMLPDADERIAWAYGRLSIVRPETAEEQTEREDVELEALAMDAERDRFIEWAF
jgi:hypothetical protein